MLEKKVSTPFQPFLERKSIGKIIFLLFCAKNLKKSHEKTFENSMELGRKIFNNDKNIGSLPKKTSSTRWNRYHKSLRL
jgi:hypothetical protein